MNEFCHKNTTKLGLIALSIFGTIAASVTVNLTVNPVLAQNDVSDSQKSQAKQLFNEGMKLYKQGTRESLTQAILKWKQAVSLYQEIKDTTGEANCLNNIGLVYSDLGEKQTALEYLQQSLQLAKTIKDRAPEARTLMGIGIVYNDLGKKQKALEYYLQSLTLFKALGDRIQEARIMMGIGNIYSALGEKQKALEYYQMSLPLSKITGDRAQYARTLMSTSLVYSELGEKSKALTYLQESLALSKLMGDRLGKTATLYNMGNIYLELGEKQKALEYYQQSLPLFTALGNKNGAADNLMIMGNIYLELGEKQKALEYYQQSLQLFKITSNRSGEAASIVGMGNVYLELGEKQKALTYYQQSLPLFIAVGNSNGEANTLNNIGLGYLELGEKQKALQYFQQSLSLSKKLGDTRAETRTLMSLGLVSSELGDKQKALEYLQQSLKLTKNLGDRTLEATNIVNIGRVYYELGEKQKALEYYQQSLLLSKKLGDRAKEAIIFSNIAITEYSEGHLQTALSNIKNAVEIVEDLRTKIVNQDLRISYFATVQNYYQLYIKILMELHQQNPKSGYDVTAFEVSEKARSRSLLDLLNEAKTDIRKGIDPQLKQKEQKLIAQLTAKTQAQLKLSSQGQDKQTELQNLVKEIEEIKTQLQQLETEIRTKNPSYAAVTQAQTFKLPEIQKQLDQDSVLLSYWLGDQQSYLWVITPKDITSYLLPNQKEIDTLADDFLISLTNAIAPVNPKTKAIELTQKILKPAQTKLEKKRLIIIPDGKLQTIPFNGLATFDSTTKKDFKPLLVDHEIINLPSASTIGFIRQDTAKRKTAPKTLAVIADPIFSSNDERVKTPNADKNNSQKLEKIQKSLNLRSGFQRIPGTRKEAEKILSLVEENQSIKIFDFDANLTNLNNYDLSQYRIIHLGTHGFVNEVNPELSGLVLSLVDTQGKEQNGLLMTPDIFNLNLTADLIVLSACETAIGKEVKGEGIVGLTRGFMYAGTSRLMLSLWKVDDQETSELMTRFYQAMLQEKLTAGAALRKAQLSMWKEGKAPYYWSAFILQGEWR
jgi:CHAT domain-containing protein/Flp pilus assembly protein TadD